MKLVKVAAATLNQTPLDWPSNARNIVEAIRAARERGVGILCLPELCITGYGCEDAFLSPNTERRALEVLEEILPETAGIVVNVGLPIRHHKALFNTSALLADGRLLGLVAKQALPGDGLHYEPRWFKPWRAGKRTKVRIGGREVPLGDLHFEVGGVRIGFEICEDAWVAARPGAELAVRGVDVILNPSASHFAFGKRDVRRRLVLEGSRAFGVTYIYANLVGNEAGRVIYDGDALIATAGAVIAEARRFSYARHELVTAVVDVELTRTRHGWLSSFSPEVELEPGERVSADFEFPAARLEPCTIDVPAWEASPSLREEELARAIPLALFDYLRKSRAQGFVVSLSGGADSAAVACFVGLMVRFALAELGVDGVRERLAHIPALGDANDARSITERLLTTVYQSTRNNSPVTRAAARAVAEAISARHLELDVDELVERYVGLAEGALGRKLVWERDDIALQNVQARVRAPSVWLLANVSGALLLSTSNRSEAAVGYATMDGDTAGSLSPIAGVDKAFLRRFLVWLERTGPDGLGPIPALAAVNAQTPTAELRPLDAGQTDEADLMPYPVLDAIERAAIRDKRAPREIFDVLRAEFPEHPDAALVGWIDRFFRLFSRNQWKRERYAPSFHVDDESLDPKTWCRFPILSGGFERELSELRHLVTDTPRGVR
ncbi:MAG: NAD(+) synthase [Pseudomonadota bacterium]|nr:MAG: NAD(+) synthase [Pseudomonadota bacterium]